MLSDLLLCLSWWAMTLENHPENLTKPRNRQTASISIQSITSSSQSKNGLFFLREKKKKASYFEASIVLARALDFPPPVSSDQTISIWICGCSPTPAGYTKPPPPMILKHCIVCSWILLPLPPFNLFLTQVGHAKANSLRFPFPDLSPSLFFYSSVSKLLKNFVAQSKQKATLRSQSTDRLGRK